MDESRDVDGRQEEMIVDAWMGGIMASWLQG
jgi:hypothetical protein